MSKLMNSKNEAPNLLLKHVKIELNDMLENKLCEKIIVEIVHIAELQVMQAGKQDDASREKTVMWTT
jgi:hypothetical protein